jgi:outer membrane protein
MRKSTASLFGIALLAANLGLAQAEELKIGFVNAARVLEEAPQAEAARGLLEKEFSPRDKKLLASQKEVKDLEDKLTRDGAIMSEPERRKLELDIINRKRDLKREQEDFREDLNIRRNEAFEQLRRRVYEVIVNLSKEQKFDLIVSDGVVYASDRIDITDQVIKRLSQDGKPAK